MGFSFADLGLSDDPGSDYEGRCEGGDDEEGGDRQGGQTQGEGGMHFGLHFGPARGRFSPDAEWRYAPRALNTNEHSTT